MTDANKTTAASDAKIATEAEPGGLAKFMCLHCLRFNADGKKQEIDPKTEICGVTRDGTGCGFCGESEAKCPLGWCAGRPFCPKDEPIPACVLSSNKGFCANCAAALWCYWNVKEEGDQDGTEGEDDE